MPGPRFAADELWVWMVGCGSELPGVVCGGVWFRMRRGGLGATGPPRTIPTHVRPDHSSRPSADLCGPTQEIHSVLEE